MSELNLPEEALETLEEEEAEAEITDEEAEEADRRRCACTLYAVVRANGTLARGHRAVSATKLGTGTYEVVFNRNVRRCAYVATIGLPGSVGSSQPGEITVVGRFGNVNGIFVTTHNSTGSNDDRAFHIAVHCRP